MPLRLNVGVSKKLGLPGYSSIGASCNLEVELENGLLLDPAGFRDRSGVPSSPPSRRWTTNWPGSRPDGEPGETGTP